jgi:hypothetical protein
LQRLLLFLSLQLHCKVLSYVGRFADGAISDPDAGPPDLVEVDSDSDSEVDEQQVARKFRKGPS